MSVQFTVPAKTRIDRFVDIPSLGDVQQYLFDCTAWAEDNATITSAVWTVEAGGVAIASQLIASGIVSAVLTFNQAGKALVSVLIGTAGAHRKKLWLEVNVKDINGYVDDYGIQT